MLFYSLGVVLNHILCLNRDFTFFRKDFSIYFTSEHSPHQKEKFYEDATKKGVDHNCHQARGSAPWSHTCRSTAAVPSSGPGGEALWAGTAERKPGEPTQSEVPAHGAPATCSLQPSLSDSGNNPAA